MALKNYTTKVPANRSIQEIQDSLIKHGAQKILCEYETGTGRIKSLMFTLMIKDIEVPFKMPVNWKLFQAVLRKDQIKRWNDEDYVYRVAWRNIRDWVLAQMALHETQMVELPQVFLPFAAGKDGQTIYEKMQKSQFLLN